MARVTKGRWTSADATGISYGQVVRIAPLAAAISGTSTGDFIHLLGDGYSPPFGYNDITTVTAGNDTIDAGNGDDFVYADLGNDRVTGGNGNDFLYGDDGNDRLTGNNGNDTLVGGQGADTLSGGAGYDLFRFDAASEISGLAEVIDGGADVDTLDFRSATGPINLSLATVTNVETLLLTSNDVTLTAAQLSQFTTISASFGTDRLILSAAGVVNLTNANLDILIDEFRGTDGQDTFTMTGVAAGQTINTLGGNDTVNAGNGNDIVNGGSGLDTLSGADGNDSLFGGDDADTLNGGTGNDLLVGGGGADAIVGGAGNDDIAIQLVSDISGLAESINGGADYDQLDFARYGAHGAVDLSAATISGVEELDLDGNQLTLTAAQLDAFVAISASFGNDTLTLSAAGTADLTGATISSLLDGIYGSAGNDTIILTGISTSGGTGLFVDGGGGGDTLVGSAFDDRFFGNIGNDTIDGGDGNDTIRGGQGTDRLTGGIGNDTFTFAGNSDISGLAETIDGGNDVDTIDFATLGAIGPIDLTRATITNVEVLTLNNNDVTLTAAQLGDFTTINAGFGVERLIISAPGTADLSGASIGLLDEIRGSSGDDVVILTGVAAGQTVNGLGGIDTITGGDGADVLSGGDGNDVLVGGNGADRITGGAGADTLTGGGGADTFYYGDVTESPRGAGSDTIRDFVHGQDVLDLAAIDANSEVAGNQTFTFIGSAAFSHVAGELQYSAATGRLFGDVNGDGVADFAIAFTGNPAITATDIVL